jgi:hypothetical protein
VKFVVLGLLAPELNGVHDPAVRLSVVGLIAGEAIIEVEGCGKDEEVTGLNALTASAISPAPPLLQGCMHMLEAGSG